MEIKEYFDTFFVRKMRITIRSFIALFLLYFAVSNVYYFLGPLISNLTPSRPWLTNTLLVFINLSIAISLILGSFLTAKMNRLQIMCAWATALLVTSLILMTVQSLSLVIVLLCIQGAFFGLGFLTFNLYFYEKTEIEERGRIGGVIVFISLLLSTPLLFFLRGTHEPFTVLIFLCLIVFATMFLKQKGEIATDERSLFEKRNFLLYFASWFIVCFNNATLLEIAFTALQLQFSTLVDFARLLKGFAACFGALVGGVLSDRVGRKLVLQFSLMILGIASTLVGLTMVDTAYIFLNIINGFSWGGFLVIYYLILWGEFSSRKSLGTCYSIGLSIFQFSKAIGYAVLPLLDRMELEVAIFISSALIFVSNIPLIFAKETLPQQYRWAPPDIEEYIESIKRELKRIRGSV